jgi:hypothetical protein
MLRTTLDIFVVICPFLIAVLSVAVSIKLTKEQEPKYWWWAVVFVGICGSILTGVQQHIDTARHEQELNSQKDQTVQVTSELQKTQGKLDLLSDAFREYEAQAPTSKDVTSALADAAHLVKGIPKPIVDFDISNQKTITVHNKGKAIEDLQIGLTEYWLNAIAYQSHQVKIDNYSRFGGLIQTTPKLLEGKTSTPIEFGKMHDLGVVPFNTGGNDSAAYLKFFAFRFVFTDPQTGTRYVYYKITSAVIGDPTFPDNPDMAGIYGSGNSRPLLADEITDVIKAHQADLDKNREFIPYIR